MFNDYIWQTYLNAGGIEVVEKFRRNLTDGFSEEYADFISDLHKCYCPSIAINSKIKEEMLDVFTDKVDGIYIFQDGEYTIESGLQFFFKALSGEEKLSDQSLFDCFSGSVAYYTTFLATEIPELFVPYYFQYNFNVFEIIANEFAIEIPPIPAKKDYKGRLFYYGKICESLLEFRDKHNMSPYELCAFLYDFAPKYIGGIESYIIKDLPEPKSAYFIGGSKKDIFLNDKMDTIACWQCNPDTRAGDMIVMYLKTPVSAVDSVWRSVSIGFIDPFFYYYRCTYIANPVSIERVTQKQLQQDEIFKELPIVRKNMQGINGVELQPSEYNHLMDISNAEVPRLEFVVCNINQTFKREKDVENKLITPLIDKLGYAENEYVQQMYIEIGNHNHALIPDFVLSPVHTKGHQSGFALIEAKLFIANQKEKEAVKIQARSYAVQLKAEYSVIADKNNILVFSSDDDYSDEIFAATWEQLNNADIFSKLMKLIGKRNNK